MFFVFTCSFYLNADDGHLVGNGNKEFSLSNIKVTINRHHRIDVKMSLWSTVTFKDGHKIHDFFCIEYYFTNTTAKEMNSTICFQKL